jgi:hypothetical protein
VGNFAHNTVKYFPYSVPRHKFRHLKFMIALSAPLHKHTRHIVRSSNVKLVLNSYKLTRKHGACFVFTQASYGPSVKQWEEFNAKTRRTIKLLLNDVNNAHRLKYLVLLEYQIDMGRGRTSCSLSFNISNSSEV